MPSTNFPVPQAPRELVLGPFLLEFQGLERLGRPEESWESSVPPPYPSGCPGLEGGGRDVARVAGLALPWSACLSVHLIESSPSLTVGFGQGFSLPEASLSQFHRMGKAQRSSGQSDPASQAGP